MLSTCPECTGQIEFTSSPVLNQLVRCDDCGADLAVTSVDPVALELTPTEEEDWGQ